MRERKQKGYYEKLHKGLIIIDHKELKQGRKIKQFSNHLISPKSQVFKELQNFNAVILSKLISSTSKSPIVKGFIQPSQKFSSFLKQNYEICNRYSDGEKLLEDLFFERERYFNENDFCCIQPNSFKLKLAKPRNFTFLDKDLIEKKLNYKSKLHFKLVVIDKKKLINYFINKIFRL